jgi:histidinol dehydrogenase
MPIPIIDDLALARRTILRRMPLDELAAPPALLDAIERTFGARLSPAEVVDRIIRDVRASA